MANANTPFGLRPVAELNNGPYSGGVRQYSVAAGNGTAIFIGDLVTLAGTSQFINGQTFQDVVQSATGDVFTGVVVGVLNDTRDSLIYRAASTQRILLVNDDPNAVFEIQQVSTGTPITANDIGLNANVVVGSGSTVTGQSGMTLDNTTEANTNTLDLKIVGMPNRADNDPGTAVGTGEASSKFYVRINRHRFVNQVAGV
jgi:hypothetical protein